MERLGCWNREETPHHFHRIMPAITGSVAGRILTETSGLSIHQDDENGEKIIAEAKWHLPGFKDRAQVSRHPLINILWAVYFIVALVFSCCLLLPVVIFIYIRYYCCAKKPLQQTERFYLTRSNLVYRRFIKQSDKFCGNRDIFCHHDFRIGLENILDIKSIGHETYRNLEGRFEARAHDVVVFQLKEDSTQQILYNGSHALVSRNDVDSFAFQCHNGEEFVQAVKEQMASRGQL